MREIKFRIWDKKVKCFFLPNLEVQQSGKNTFTFGFSSKVKHPENHPLMQYTGLKDKNGKEIFEGDIVEIDEDENLTGEVMYDKDRAGFIMYFDDAPADIHFEDSDILQIIGNIYENPELIDK